MSTEQKWPEVTLVRDGESGDFLGIQDETRIEDERLQTGPDGGLEFARYIPAPPQGQADAGEKLLNRIAKDLDDEFKRQASDRPPAGQYQGGFDAGIHAVKKLLAHPSYRKQLLGAAPLTPGLLEKLEAEVEHLSAGGKSFRTPSELATAKRLQALIEEYK